MRFLETDIFCNKVAINSAPAIFENLPSFCLSQYGHHNEYSVCTSITLKGVFTLHFHFAFNTYSCVFCTSLTVSVLQNANRHSI